MIDAVLNRLSVIGMVASDASYKEAKDFILNEALTPYTDSDADHLKLNAFKLPQHLESHIDGFEYAGAVEGDLSGFGAIIYQNTTSKRKTGSESNFL